MDHSDGKYRKSFRVPMSMCDAGGRLSPVQVAAIFQDAATEDAERRGIGLTAMREKRFYWLTARAKYRFLALPRVMSPVVAATWPNPFHSALCDRCYSLEDGAGNLLAEGRTEWAVFDPDSGAVARELDPIFLGQPTLEETRCPGRKLRMSPDFSAAEALGTYAVTSQDIDIGQHMNNVAYLRALFSCRSAAELAAAPLAGLEIVYRSPALEGETLVLRRRAAADGEEVGILHADGSPAALVKLFPS